MYASNAIHHASTPGIFRAYQKINTATGNLFYKHSYSRQQRFPICDSRILIAFIFYTVYLWNVHKFWSQHTICINSPNLVSMRITQYRIESCSSRTFRESPPLRPWHWSVSRLSCLPIWGNVSTTSSHNLDPNHQPFHSVSHAPRPRVQRLSHCLPWT